MKNTVVLGRGGSGQASSNNPSTGGGASKVSGTGKSL